MCLDLQSITPEPPIVHRYFLLEKIQHLAIFNKIKHQNSFVLNKRFKKTKSLYYFGDIVVMSKKKIYARHKSDKLNLMARLCFVIKKKRKTVRRRTTWIIVG